MRNTILGLLAVILIITIVNLLSGLGIIGGGGSSSSASGSNYEYQVLNPAMMDNIGFRAVAKEEGIEVGEDGKINFPKEMVAKIAKVNLLPKTISAVEADGGWTFVSVTADNHYIFRRTK